MVSVHINKVLSIEIEIESELADDIADKSRKTRFKTYRNMMDSTLSIYSNRMNQPLVHTVNITQYWLNSGRYLVAGKCLLNQKI